MERPTTDNKSKKRKKMKSKQNDQTPEPHMEVEVDTALENMDEMEADETETSVLSTYIPNRSRPLLEDEQLVMDKSSYRLFHELQVELACLSFDILLDNLGMDRLVDANGPIISSNIIAGTQALNSIDNKLVVMRLSNMKPFHRKEKPNDAQGDADASDSDSDDESSSDEEDLDSKPELEAASIQHKGTVNRVRANRFGGRYLAASWSELGTVSIWDLTRPLTAVHDSAVMSEYARHNESPKPLYVHKGHRTEGFALDWSPHTSAAGHMASGDCAGRIFHWIPRPTGWNVNRSPYTGHTSSVEDIQWSSTEPTVFISVSADHSIRVWDTRSPSTQGSMLTVPEAHPADINVLSWNRINTINLLTGGDDGSLRIWDLRLMTNNKSEAAYTHLYDFHKAPITSVEWHPTDAGVFVATCEDNQVTLWDNTLEQAERQDDTMATDGDDASNGEVLNDLPVQLLFIHCGQTEIKEAHWHPQLPGMLIVTGLEGFNVFRTCNV